MPRVEVGDHSFQYMEEGGVVPRSSFCAARDWIPSSGRACSPTWEGGG